MERIGVSPIDAGLFLEHSLRALRKKNVLKDLPADALRQEAEAVRKILPDHFFPDVFIDLPLMGGGSEGMAAVFDCYERCFLDHSSEGAYFKAVGLPAMNAPENRDDLVVYTVKGNAAGYFVRSRKLQESPDEKTLNIPSLNRLKDLPLRYWEEPRENGCRLIVTTGSVHTKNRFGHLPYKEKMLEVLAEAGCDREMLCALEQASFNLGLPFYHAEYGYTEKIAYVDVPAFVLSVREQHIRDCHALIRISEKSRYYAGELMRPNFAYQWHITDNCDQRCKHCYLFAEDAKLKCMSTSWEQLMQTLEEITRDAVIKASEPFLAVSGGDPILHPDFWRFAEELHRRGIRWIIMGNPFHLTPQVCTRLYQLGCMVYQQSLDGLSAFHDYMRKPGSFAATLRGVKILNDAGIKSDLMATVSRQNLEYILSCMDIAAEHHAFGFTFARYCATSPEKAEDSYPTPEEYRDFLLRYYRKAKEYREKGCRTEFLFKEHLFRLLWYELGEFQPTEFSKTHPDVIFDGCHLGQGCTILPNGDVLACRRMDSVIGNIRTESLHTILTGEACQRYAAVKDIKKCRDCELLQWCRGCRAVGYNVSGDLQGEDPCCWKKM